MASTETMREAAEIFAGDGELRALCRALDWDATPLGRVEGWSHSLRTTVGAVLASRHPMFLFWGPELVQVYNDAYRPSLGEGGRHPRALGMRGRDFWTDIWDAIGPQIDAVMTRGEASWHVDQLLPIERNGRFEEVYWTYSYSPVRDDDGTIAGTLVVCQETTERVFAERRLRTLHRLAAIVPPADAADAAAAAASTLAADALDAPFALCHLPASDGQDAAPVLVGSPDLARRIPADRWPLDAAIESGRPQLVDLAGWEEIAGLGPWPEPPASAVVLPLRVPGADRTLGALVVGLSPRISWDEGYRAFVSGAATHVASQIAAHRLGAERERLVRELEVAGARLEEIFRQAPAFLAVLRGPAHVFELANDAYYQLVGHRELIGRPVLDAMPEVEGQGFVEMLDGVLATGIPFVGRELPVSLARTTGAPPEVRFVDFVYQPLVAADGTRAGIVAHGSDVTEQVVARRDVERLLRVSEQARREAEGVRAELERVNARLAAQAGALDAANAALRASEARLRDVFEQVPIAVAVMTGPTHVYTIVSPRYAESPGGGRPLLGRAVRDAFPELEGQGYAEMMDHVYQTGEPYAASERRVLLDRDNDGVTEEYFYNVGYHPLRDAEGRVYGIVSAAYDVTAQIHARRELEAARAEAEAANRAKSEFLAVMSHELRTPLNAIGGYAELLELGIRGPVTAQQREDLRRIQTSQRHLLGLINEVLNYARIETGAVHYDTTEVAIADVVASVEPLVAPQLAAKGLDYATGPAAPSPSGRSPVARADRDKTRQVLLNLLSNAAKFTDPGGRVEVAYEASGDEVAVRVRDTGIGIAADQLERVFEPFVQVNAALTRTHEGTGLGLAISRDLARGMGGDLTVESVVGAGSTFTLTLPRAGND